MKYLEKLKNNKLIAVILIIGIALMLIPTGNKGKKEISDKSEEYAESLTKELEEILSLIDRAGRVRVMITLEDRGQTFPVTDINGRGESIQERTVSVSGELAVSRESYPKVRGVAVAAEGADESRVREEILATAKALTGAEAHNIRVFKLKGQED